jgi:hypothetical protein
MWMLDFYINYQVAYAVDARIDFSSNYTFGKQLIKVQTTNISGHEYILILFSDSTISKFTTDMVEV